MAVPPFLKSLVEVDQALAQLRRGRIAPIRVDQDGLQGRGRLDWTCDVPIQNRGGDAVAAAREAGEDGGPQSPRGITGLGVTPPHVGPPYAPDAPQLARFAR